MMTQKSAFVDDIAIQAMMKQHKANDYLVLDDAILAAALDNARPLYRSEWKALLGSPLTLRRMQVLANLRQKKPVSAPQMTVQRDAANDPLWFSSAGRLRAADNGVAAPVLTTEDGVWQLLFLKSTTGWRMVLKLDLDALFAPELLKELPELAVLDGHKQALLVAHLDEDGEVTGTWPLPNAPYAHFVAHGGKFDVVRV